MTKVTDPRTGKDAWIEDTSAYWQERGAALKPCLHNLFEIREFTMRNDATSIWKQCMTCGVKFGQAVPKKGNPPPADLSISERYDAERKRIGDAVTCRHIDLSLEHGAAWWETYNAYLTTPEWRRRTELVRKRCGGICEGCGEHPVQEVHHRTYRHVTAEFLFELVGLCHACHERIHAEEENDRA